MTSGDTIFALSSGALPAGIAVIRVSGPNADRVGALMRGGLPKDRRPVVRAIEAAGYGVIDRAMVLRMRAPHSFTGEDTIELHLHGGKAVVTACLDVLGKIQGFRPAEPGEFTQRSFLHGKVDLYEAEALGDLIAAETEFQRRLSVENSSGENARVWSQWMTDLTEARALLEAELDFADEEDIPDSLRDPIVKTLERICDQMDRELSRVHDAEIMRDGYRVVLTGPPNVGKSSLLNALAKRDVAIVSDEAGTTRDLVEVALNLGGCKVVLTDTAGLREATGTVERIGIERALSAIGNADLVLRVFSLDHAGHPDFLDQKVHGLKVWTVLNKKDIASDSRDDAEFLVSAKTGDGLDQLISAIASEAAKASHSGTGFPLLFKGRHVELCRQAKQAIGSALYHIRGEPELAAEELRRAMLAIARVTGAVDVEDLLGVIFSRFCIGK